MSSFPSVHLLRRLAFLGVAAVPLAAQESPPPMLTLREALARAEQRHPALAASGFRERAADGLVAQAGQRPALTLDIEAENFGGFGALSGVRGLEATVQARQTIERGGKREKRVGLATRERDTIAADQAVRRAEIRTATALAFVDVVVTQQNAALAAEPLRLARELAELAQRRERAGDASALESARARAAIATAQADVLRAEAGVGAARARLAAQWAGEGAEAVAVAGALRVPEPLPTLESIGARLPHHPRIAHQQALVEERRAALELERAQSAPDFAVGGGVRFVREGSDAGFVAGVSVPLAGRSRNQGSLRAARETLAGAEQAVRAAEAELRAAFSAAWQEVRAAHATVFALRQALPASEEAHALTRRAFAQGQASPTEIFEAQRTLVALHRQIAEAEAAFLVAHVRAEALVDASFPATAALLSSR